MSEILVWAREADWLTIVFLGIMYVKLQRDFRGIHRCLMRDFNELRGRMIRVETQLEERNV